MGSLPEDPLERFAKFIAFTRQGFSAEEVARQWELGSEAALFHILRQDGFPICEVCGEYSKEQTHGHEPEERSRKAHYKGGRSQETPSGAGVVPLLKEALSTLERAIFRVSLDERKMLLRDRRFESVDAFEEPITFRRRSQPSEEAWRALCEEHGEDPQQEEFTLWGGELLFPKGAYANPPEPWPMLIGTYILAGKPLEVLVEKLALDPRSVDWERLKLHIEGKSTKEGTRPGLLGEARRVARLIFGGSLQDGPDPAELSAEEHGIVWRIHERRAQGVPDSKIYPELRREHGLSKPDYERLKKFPPPDFEM